MRLRAIADPLRRAIKSPQLLELSGIGQKNILEKAGIEPKLDLPSVGENLQEHITAGITFREFLRSEVLQTKD